MSGSKIWQGDITTQFSTYLLIFNIYCSLNYLFENQQIEMRSWREFVKKLADMKYESLMYFKRSLKWYKGNKRCVGNQLLQVVPWRTYGKKQLARLVQIPKHRPLSAPEEHQSIDKQKSGYLVYSRPRPSLPRISLRRLSLRKQVLQILHL